MTPARTALRALAAACSLALAVSASAAGAPKRPVDTLKFPPLNPIQEPKVETVTLPNGLTVLMVEDHELPIVKVKAVVKGGKAAAAKPALIDLFDEVHRTGGTATMPGDKVDEFLEGIGAGIETSVSDGFSTLNAKMLKDQVGKVLPLFAEFLQAPGFEQVKIDLAKTQLKSGIARRNDDPMGIGRREFVKLVYGADSPYARQLEYDQIDALTRDDLMAFHGALYVPANTLVAIWGDMTTAEMKQQVEKALGAWKGGPAPKVPAAPVPEPAFSVNYAEKADAEQTTVLMGHAGLRLDDPDYAAVYVMTDILGGGFSSRIFTQVRTLKGLAYGAGGFMVPAYDHRGVFYFFTSTKPSTTAEAISTMLDEIDKIRKAPVTDEELTRSKSAYLNSYAFEFDSTDKIVNRALTYLVYGYPADFNARLRAAIEKVTQDDVLKAAQKHLLPEKLALVAVGDAKNFDKPLSTFGPTRTLDIAIPEPKPTEVLPEATPETLKAGTAVLMKSARARGEAALKGMKDLSVEGDTTIVTPMGEMALKVKAVLAPPDRMWSQAQTPMGAMVQVLSGNAAWMTMGPQVRPLPADEIRKGLPSEAGCAYLLQQVLLGKLQGQFIGEATFEGATVSDILVKTADSAFRLYVDVNGTLLGMKTRTLTQEGPAEVVETYADWRDAGGLKIPFETVQKANGEVAQRSKLTSAKVNAGVDPKLFEKPAAPAAEAK